MTYAAPLSVRAGYPGSNHTRHFSHHARSPQAAAPNIVLVTAQPLFRSALCWAMTKTRPDARITEVGGLSDACDALRQNEFSLVVFDEDPFDSSVSHAIKAVKTEFSVPVALFSSDTSRSAARRAFDYGVCGYVSKSSSLEEMAAALCKLTERAHPGRSEQRRIADSISSHAEKTLTPAQVKVLALMEEGQLNKQIAHGLGIAESTVKAHVSAILRKLNVQNRVQATLVANRQFGRASAYATEVAI